MALAFEIFDTLIYLIHRYVQFLKKNINKTTNVILSNAIF